MIRAFNFAAFVLLASLGAAAKADSFSRTGETAQLAPDAPIMPPDGHAGQWWTHPIGCEYSRAGRPGETVWYLIVNTARPGCPTYIVRHGFGDVY